MCTERERPFDTFQPCCARVPSPTPLFPHAPVLLHPSPLTPHPSPHPLHHSLKSPPTRSLPHLSPHPLPPPARSEVCRVLVSLLEGRIGGSHDPEIAEAALWAMTNLACDAGLARRLVQVGGGAWGALARLDAPVAADLQAH